MAFVVGFSLILYYRLRITDFSGEVVYSPVCIVKNKTAGTVQVIPVPATSILTIINADASLNGKSAVIYDMQGRVRLRFTISALLAIPVRDWVSGIYSLHLPDSTVQRLVKE